ncbi:MAG: heat-inducible transcriptional repressor HrcA [Sphingomonadaceae bacterium]|nr:heat-inducible transcriptional repressor HrcA [Sphingomonadaceae bacterium]
MATPPITELTSRAREIFRLVVEGYLTTGQAVGSKALAGTGALNLSPASIRSVLHELEGLGLLAAPHTSAGRLPTEQGLRLFVDGIMQVAEPSLEERAAIERSVSQPGPIEAAHLQLVPLAADRALAVLVGTDGAVENRVVPLAPGVTAAALEQASNYISAHLAGRTLAEAIAAIRTEIDGGRSALDAASRDLVERGLAVWSEDALSRPVLIVRGQANLLDDLESKQSIAELLDSAREAEATRIFIGAENRLFALSGSSVIASPYRDRDGRVVGVVGVIGPTRLNYARLVPMVDFTAQSLGKLIG